MPANDTYVGQILRVLAADPARTVLTWQDGSLTAAGFTASVRSAAQVLHRRGGRPADGPGGATDTVVAILTTTNSPATLLLRYAANLIGATAVHLHTTNAVDPGERLTRDAELAILTETRATVLAVDADHLPLARELLARLPQPPLLAALGDLGPDVLDLTAGADTDPPEVPIPPDRSAVTTYTSGTTGRPKGIAVDFRTRNGFIAAGLQMAWRAVYLATLPMSHSSGATADDSLASGGSVVLHRGFDAGEVLRAVAEHRVTRLLISPPQLYRLMDHPAAARTDLSSITMLCYTGSPASPARLAEAVERFGDVLIQIYGTSEAGAIGMLTPADHHEPELRSTVGRVLAGEVRVRDPYDHHDLPPGEVGEICVRSPFAMREYLGDPELTARTVRDGWVHTGDLGRLDERGYIHLSGRLADVVKTNGIKIHPTAVENALTAHPGVVQAAAFGVPDTDLVEHLHAAVVLRDGAAATVAALREHLATALSPQHVPDVIAVRPELPLTATGKPDRARLVADARR
ncbi:class I adenylate-forming enzyme family protein [Kitasatospora sp. NPDC088346]|uniref:class I adenylate-forming enzyme family protein n=1 Tax=Kitasatospora sp. NPDC088346 TaxID=3364073 RepID=UPI0037F1BF3D